MCTFGLLGLSCETQITPSTTLPSGNSDLPPPVIAGNFVKHPAPPSVVTSSSVPQLDHSFSPHSEFGPPRLTCFLENAP